MKGASSAVVLLCCLGFAVAGQASPQHVHDHSSAQPAAAASVPAQRWTPDASLREGIRRAHTAVDQLKHYEMGHMSGPMAADRAGEVADAATYIFAHCKLDAAPDAALHGILVPLLGAAQALKADPAGHVAAVGDMRAALARYPQYFDDPGWNAPAPVGHVMHDEP